MASSGCAFWPFGASTSSSPTNFLLLSRTNIERICELIRLKEPLNPHQCLSMSSKLKATVKNIESLAYLSEDINPIYGCVALENFYRVSEKAKKLVENCCSVDWCPASAFQIQNEEAFREILLETSLSYSIICELLEDSKKGNFYLDLRGSSTFDPPSAKEIFKDRVALRDRLKGLVNAANISSSDLRSLQLGKYLLRRVNFVLKQSIDKDFDANLSLDGEVLDGEWSEKSDHLGGSVIKTAWLDVPCAKKVFEDTLREDEWLAEAKILASLNHPNIVKFLCCNKYETVHASGHFIAMEQMETSLGSFIRRRKERRAKLSLFLALDIILQIGYGMCYLHDNGIAHRDLKTTNVVCSIIQEFLEVKVVDFGLAKIKLNLDKSNSISRPKMGTTTYMAPEAFSNGRANWFKADVYSFSVMCSVILSGEEPFQGIKRNGIYAAVCSGQRPKLPVNIPKELASVIKEGWAQDRDLRPSFLDICARLEKLRHRLLRKHSLPSLGLRLKGEDPYDEEYPNDLYVKKTMKKRSELRQSDPAPGIARKSITEEEWFDGDEVEELQQSVQVQEHLPQGLAFQEGVAIAEDGRGGTYGSSSTGGGGGGVSPQSVGIALHLSSTSPLWSSPTGRGPVEWLSESPPWITSHPLSIEAVQAQARVQALAIPRQLSNPAASATHPSSSGANQCCPRPSLVSRNGLAMDYLDVDYCAEASSSIKLIQEMVSAGRGQLHLRQCQYLSSKMSDTGNFLTAKLNSLVGITSGDDIQRKALRQLHFTVKRAETLVRGCCCEVEPSWLESAVTLAQIKEEIVHILLDLRWWTSMVDIAIASVTWVTRGQKIEQELLEVAEKDVQQLLEEFKSRDNELDEAVTKDKEQLLQRVREVLNSYSGEPRDLDYLLATHVRTRLENIDLVQSMTNVDLNEYKLASFIGSGTFGAVMNVQWLGRSCAMKVLNYKCVKEARSLSSFQHPHIVQFFRYWEEPVSSKLGKSTPYSTPRGSNTAMESSTSAFIASVAPPEVGLIAQSHILMELLPTDLAKYMHNSATNAMPQDVAIDMMLQVTKAMWHLNTYNVAHRDLKPSNVLVQPVSPKEVPELAARGYVRVKLGDFGLVNTKATSIVNSTVSRNVGTRIYGAPEVFIKDSSFLKESPRFPRLTDVWSFGIMFSEVLSGQPPFLVDERHGSVALHAKIQRGLRPQLPKNCPDYLKFCITNCLQFRPQGRPSFADLWKLLRFAQVRSLGIIREDHDLFTFTTREGMVKRLHKPKQSAPNKDPKSFGLIFRQITSLSTRRRESSTKAIQNSNRKQSRAGSSKTQSEGKPLGYLVNSVGTEDVTSGSTKLDVIFFEGNVGQRKYLSCMDTWVQRGQSDVWWPRDWLSKDFNGDIRVLLLEYCISENGVEGVVEELQKLLVFSDRWNRGHTWNRPIVLVGHSLGCVVIEQLVVALNKRAESFGSLKGHFEANRANVSKAFLASLAGCFFYAPPYTGLVPSEDMLKDVFGGLTYSPTLFNDLCLTSLKPKELSERFMEARSHDVQLVALTEGFRTRGRIVVPAASMDDFEASGGRVEELSDSNHSDTCKPIDKKHPAYRFLFEFIQELL